MTILTWSVKCRGRHARSGGDGTLTFGFGTNVAPAGFTYDTSVANTLLIKQGSTTVITITINPTTGAYSVTQNNPIHHDARRRREQPVVRDRLHREGHR
jgi:hypothetical protein